MDLNILEIDAYQYMIPILILIISGIIAKLVFSIIKGSIKKFAERTKTELDNLILNYVEKPFILIILLLGIRYSFSFINISEGATHIINNIIYISLVLDISWFIIGLTNALFENYFSKITRKTKTKLDDMLLPIMKKVITISIFLIAIMVILSNFGYDITALLGGVGIVGIALAMAAQDTIKDILGGMTVITNRPFEIGDAVNIDGIGGIVEEISIRYIRLRTWSGTIVTIPNSKLGATNIENYSKAKERKITIDIGVTYETPAKKIELAMKILKEIANSEKGIEKEKTQVYLSKYADSAIILRLYYYMNKEGIKDFFGLQHRINLKIKKEFDKNKIDMAYPTQTIYLKK
ncbi:mechanosensitive ion channel family protein [Candidatus Micrarchaeota archaeon]|nr:mechanosensitive ion channel family protein [Candidatus Micrarchaeota archaeon]